MISEGKYYRVKVPNFYNPTFLKVMENCCLKFEEVGSFKEAFIDDEPKLINQI